MKPSDAAADAAAALPELPREEDGAPVFAEPWQANVFALALTLHESGVFTWKEWADRLAKEIEAAQSRGDPDFGDTYYHHWLAALEGIVVERDILSASGLRQRRDAWDRAARTTPHGEPIVLGRERNGS